MKKSIILFSFCLSFFAGMAQDSTSKSSSKSSKKEEKRQRISAIIRQEEEGVLSYRKQSLFGLQLRTNGYGLWYELGWRRSPRWTNVALAELTEIKNGKEEKLGNSENIFGNSFIYGKRNNFYQFKLGYGQQYIFGQKGNKNGVAVTGSLTGGLSLGLLKPYYLEIDSAGGTFIRYDDNPSAFLDPNKIIGGAGIGKGFKEIKIKPGAFVKAGLRFDFGRYNESIQALEIGISADYFTDKIEILLMNKTRSLFYQGHIAFVFGRRK